MSDYRAKSRGRRVKWIGTAMIAVAIGATAGCSEETPVAPNTLQQMSTANAREKNFSFSITSADRTLHVRFTRVRSDESESVSAFVQRMFASADSAGAKRLIVDLRSTTGGDTFLLVPLVKGVVARERFAQRGGLVVLLGPKSFSPGQSAATLLQRYANPIFVGPTACCYSSLP
jgi:hypothetical protein